MPDDKIVLGVLRTVALQDHSAASTSVGQFELEVTAPYKIFMESGDKRGYAIHLIGKHLAAAVLDTMVDTAYWQFVSHDKMIKEFNFSPVMSFNRSHA